MPSSLSMQARWEVIQHLSPRYQQAPRAQKTHLLNECEHLYPPVFEARFIQGFLDYGSSLPPAWKKTTKLVDLLSLCRFLDSPISGAAVQEEVMGLIMRMRERWQEYPD